MSAGSLAALGSIFVAVGSGGCFPWRSMAWAMLSRPVMKNIGMAWAVPLTITGLLLACGGANQGPAVTGTPESPGVTAPQKGADNAVVDQLAQARCDQEQGCNNIGPGAQSATRSVCTETIHGSTANALPAYNGPRGLRQDGVDRCMAAIKSEECNHPFDTLTRFDKCRTGAICMN